MQWLIDITWREVLMSLGTCSQTGRILSLLLLAHLSVHGVDTCSSVCFRHSLQISLKITKLWGDPARPFKPPHMSKSELFHFQSHQ